MSKKNNNIELNNNKNTSSKNNILSNGIFDKILSNINNTFINVNQINNDSNKNEKINSSSNKNEKINSSSNKNEKINSSSNKNEKINNNSNKKINSSSSDKKINSSSDNKINSSGFDKKINSSSDNKINSSNKKINSSGSDKKINSGSGENISHSINILLKELLKKQIKNICLDKKLNYNDIIRISKFLSSSIFDNNKCAIWKGYITNEKKQSKGTYINFYFNKKKIALHRLLYINYVEDISNNEYIKFSCNNKGKCCNINHMKKYIYNTNLEKNNDLNNIKNTGLPNICSDKIQINYDKKKLIIEL